MFKLLNSEDKFVLNNVNFVKNATLYKDMLCFYEAYSLIMERDNLPNFCYLQNKKICLEGICLLMKMYATEFKFETLKLTLDYLKILYFLNASYAEDDLVDRNLIVLEFYEYREASLEYCDTQRAEFEEKRKVVSKANKDIKQKLQKSRKMQKNGKVLSVLSIVLFVLSVLSICAPVLVSNLYPNNKVLIWSLIVGVIVGFVLTIAFMVSGKILKNSSSDLAFHVQNLKKNNTLDSNELSELEMKYYKVFCEKYEYKTSFPELFSKYTKVLTIDEIIEKSRNYKILSYNIVSDITKIFKSQQQEINSIVSDIDAIVLSGDFKKDFEAIYKKICEQDWLYYNSEIRINFLKKFTDISERDFDWKLAFNGKEVNPFDVDIRELSREIVAFSSEKDKKLISAPLSDLMQTKFFKNMDDLNFRNGYTTTEFKKVKANYLKHFYNYNIIQDVAGVMYDKKETQKLKKAEAEIDELEKVPTLVSLKLKLIENLAGLGNSDANVIKSLSESLFKPQEEEVLLVHPFSEQDIDYPKFTAQRTEEFDEYFLFEVNGKKKKSLKTK